MIVIGIDPGTTGAVCVCSDTFGLEIFDTPVDYVVTKSPKTKTGTKTRAEFDILAMSKLLDHIINRYYNTDAKPIMQVVIEQVGCRPTDGVIQAFNFGFGFGVWLALLTAKNFTVTKVRPQAWKKQLGLIGTDKDESRQLALRLFPLSSELFKRKKDHNRAEAALLTQYK